MYLFTLNISILINLRNGLQVNTLRYTPSGAKADSHANN